MNLQVCLMHISFDSKGHQSKKHQVNKDYDITNHVLTGRRLQHDQ